MDNNKNSGLLDLLSTAKQQKSYGKTKLAVGALTDTFSSFVEYDALKTSAKNYDIQASNIQLQAKQRANQVRQQFIQTAGSYAYNAAQRGVSVNSASVKSNLEGSAESLGKDLQLQEQNANIQASALRQQGKIASRTARTKLITGLLDTTTTVAGGFNG